MEITKLKRILKCKGGQGFPLAIAVTLCLLLLLCVIMEYFRITAITQGVRDALQSSVVSVATENYDDVYHGVREGYAGGYQPYAGGFEQSLDYGNIYAQLDKHLGLNTEAGGYHVRYASGAVEYKVSDLSMGIQNTSFRPNPGGSTFVVRATVTLEIPVRFAGKLLPPLKVTIGAKATYMPLFTPPSYVT